MGGKKKYMEMFGSFIEPFNFIAAEAPSITGLSMLEQLASTHLLKLMCVSCVVIRHWGHINVVRRYRKSSLRKFRLFLPRRHPEY